ncbi:LacI family DNA-binding transcriptional regulator [Pseudovibrio exalbescens]|uniref:HTH lacI-type domain-containing protein n=1 Tax=Pseudovibrio exalbescens TaxID=197461 RepID=A0A1U7JGB3_9HYPH|nr:LacI family DNA-binding transcriptional regulator [Pseudovibrio exalbescens]OKL43783.1 hypothetical protein A3843_11715 [Pseudovibrio exalbescens]
MKRPATLKDIAEYLGVSTATVSRGLARDPRVTESTQRRVWEAAKTLDYRPNVIARSLRTKKTGVVLLVVRDIKNSFYLDVMVGVEAAAREANYSVLMCNCENDSALVSTYLEMLKDGRADGMILMTGKLPQSVAEDPQLAQMPIVLALEAIENCSLPLVQIDNVAAGMKAVQHLIDLGHERIAHVRGPEGELMSQRRLIGYRQAMQQAGLPVLPDYEQAGTFELHSAEHACRVLMALDTPPTAIFFANDEMAAGAIKLLRRMGYAIPEDISLVGFDNTFWCEVSDPGLTTVDQPRFQVGQEAFGLLHSTLSGEEGGEKTIVLPTELYVRESTTSPKSKK